MAKTQRIIRPLVFSLLPLASLLGMPAMAQGTATSIMAPISGGIGESERTAMLEQKSQYNLWVRTAAKRSGAYLAGVHIRILETPSKKTILEHSMDGPWLFATLAPGRYEVEASYRENLESPEQTLKQTTTLHVRGRQELIFYFDSTATVGNNHDNAAKNGKN